MRARRKGDFDLCVKEANLFYGLASSLVSENPFNLVTGAKYPYAVNMSFACELYMKALMIHKSAESTFTKGHNLKMLYDELDEEYKSQIDSDFRERIKARRGLDYFLDSQGDVFEGWRYAFEPKDQDRILDYSGFSALGCILNNIVNGIGG